jgi:hypothetical protein
MLSEIIDKLAAELKSTEELTEPRVVYTLVQVRKLIEAKNEAVQYPLLKFFCDWAVHSKLDKTGASRVIKLFDDFQETALTKSSKEYLEHGERLRGEVLDAEVFRTELQRFFVAVPLPDNLCIEDKRWYSFLSLYGKVIHETPLEIKTTSMKYIKSVTVSYETVSTYPLRDDEDFLFGLRWTPIRLDGRPASSHTMNFTMPKRVGG